MTRNALILAVIGVCTLAAGCTDEAFRSHSRYPAYPDAYPDRWPDRNGWTVTRHDGETDYEIRDEVLFPLDSAELTPRAHDIIADVADAARHTPRARIEVDGYTDTSGTAEHNLSLSQARAEHVADVLIHEGVPARRILARGLGETHLAVPTPDGVREARNRRVVIRILPPR